jgi:ssDNA-specific exonuclease RecJ
MNISKRNLNRLIQAYKALFEKTMKEYENTSLSTDQLQAVGKRILDESIETAFNNQNIPEQDRPAILKQFENLLRKECPEMIFDTPLTFDENGFSKRQ